MLGPVTIVIDRYQTWRERTRSARKLYRILIDDIGWMCWNRLEARRADYSRAARLKARWDDCINADYSSRVPDYFTRVFNTTRYPHIDFLREVEGICQHEQHQLDSWIASGGHGPRPKTPLINTILKASRSVDVPYGMLCHEVQEQARGDFMLYNGACRLIIEGRFPELAVKMELDEWDQLVGLGFGESNRIKEKAMMKKVREEWLESLQVGTVLNEFE